MKKKTQKLSLRKVNITSLQSDEAAHVAGGIPRTYRNGCPDPVTSVNVPCPSQRVGGCATFFCVTL